MSRDQSCNSLSSPSETASRPALSIRRSLKAEESQAMLEIMQGDVGMQCRPKVQQKRVHKLGRTVSDRSEVCQWIQPMMQEAAPPGMTQQALTLNMDNDGSYAVSASSSSSVNVTTNATATAATNGLHCTGSRGDVTEPKTEVLRSNSGANPQTMLGGQGNAAGDESELSYEEQLNTIRQQQLVLLEQERAIQEKVKQRDVSVIQNAQQGRQEQDARQTTAAAEQTSTQSSAPSEADEVNRQSAASVTSSLCDPRRRRLKGSLASLYARRDEGTVGSLLWYGGGEDQQQVPPSPSEVSASSQNAARRYANLKQENSSSIAQLLSQTSFLESRLAQGSDSSATCTMSQSTSATQDA